MHRNYSFVWFLLLNIFCNLINAYISEKCNKVEENSSILQLNQHLLCEYDSDVRPVQSNKNVTRLEFHITMHLYEYIQDTQIFSLHTWTYLIWKDMHLTWKPQDYDNIHEMVMSIYDVWVPDIIMNNEYEDGNYFPTQTSCLVKYDGEVTWVYPAKYSVYCIGDITWWPYDVLNCTLEFHSWSHSNDEIEFITTDKEVSIIYEQKQNLEWSLLNTYITKRVEKHKYNLGSTANIISYHFIMRRNWGIISIAYVTPIIVLMVITLITLWLEPKSTERMIVANLNFICHLLCMKEVHFLMPHNGFNTPKLLIFYNSSFAIATFTLILTTILRYLQELSSEPPWWVSVVTMSILYSKVGRILLINVLDPITMAKIEINADDNMDLMHVMNKKSSWTYVTVLIGWLALLSVSLTYIILLSISFSV